MLAQLPLEPSCHRLLGLGDHELLDAGSVVGKVRAGAASDLDHATAHVCEKRSTVGVEGRLLGALHHRVVAGGENSPVQAHRNASITSRKLPAAPASANDTIAVCTPASASSRKRPTCSSMVASGARPRCVTLISPGSRSTAAQCSCSTRSLCRTCSASPKKLQASA